MKRDIQEIMFDEAALKAKVSELGARITEDYAGKDLIVCGILNGAFIFCADLARAIDLPISVDFMRVSSYGKGSETSGEVKIIKDMDVNIAGRHLLLVEDIIDSGVTMQRLMKLLSTRRPASIKLCALLSKPSRRKTDIKIDYLGWEVPDEFIVGYGLDYAERYRNIPAVAILRREVYAG